MVPTNKSSSCSPASNRLIYSITAVYLSFYCDSLTYEIEVVHNSACLWGPLSDPHPSPEIPPPTNQWESLMPQKGHAYWLPTHGHTVDWAQFCAACLSNKFPIDLFSIAQVQLCFGHDKHWWQIYYLKKEPSNYSPHCTRRQQCEHKTSH